MLLAVRLDDGTEVLRSAKAGSLEAEALRLDDSLRATFEALKRPRPECMNQVGGVAEAGEVHVDAARQARGGA